MKYLKSLSLLGIILLVLNACSSMDVEAVKKIDKSAVASVTVNKWINMGEFSASAALAQHLVNSEDFDLTPVVKQLHQKTFEEYQPLLPLEFVEEEVVLNNQGYQEFELYKNANEASRAQKDFHYITYENYRAIHPNEFNLAKHRLERLWETMPEEVEALVFVNANYTLDKKKSLMGFGYARVESQVSLYIFNREGEKIMKVNKNAESDETVKFALSGGVLEADEIQPLCKNATEKAFQEMEAFLKDELADA